MMKKLFAALGAIMAVLVVTVFALPWIVPQSFVEARLGHLLERSTGLRLEEAQRVRFSVFPAPGIIVEGVSVRLPERAGNLPPITAESIFAAIRPSSLFERRLAVSRVVITRPSIQFQADASGHSNWDLTGGAAKRGNVRLTALVDAPPPSGESSPLIQPLGQRHFKLPTAEIEIVDGEFGFDHEAQRRHIELRNFNLTLRRVTPDGAAVLEGSMKLQGEDVRLHATAAEPGLSGDAPLQVRLESEALQWTLDGVLTWAKPPRFSGTTRLAVQSGERLAAWLGSESKALANLNNSAFDGRLEISNSGLVLTDAAISGPGTEGSLEATISFAGTANATLKSLSLHGGQGHGRLTIDASGPSAAVVSGSFEVSGVDTLALSTAISSFDWISGRADVAMQIAGGGNNLASITGTLTGEGHIQVSKGALEGLDLPLIVAKVKDGEFGKWHREPGRRTEFDSFAATFKLNKGVATTEDMALTGPNITATGTGETDIAHQRLNYRLKTRITAREEAPVEGAAADSLAIPLVIKGDWQRPAIRPDITAALKDTKGLSGNAKLLGKSVEKYTKGAIKSEELGRTLNSLFRKKKKKDEQPQPDPGSEEPKPDGGDTELPAQ